MKDQSCAILIKKIHSELEKRANNTLREDELTLVQISVLQTLWDAEDRQLSMKQLEEILHVSQPTMVGIIKRLEQKKLVDSHIGERKAKIISPTPLGIEYIHKSLHYMEEIDQRLLHTLTETEVAILKSLLQKVCSSFH